ncbi:MAG TPA: thymidylate kinase [bacterium]|nr:thymidylate kinase [bacterium]
MKKLDKGFFAVIDGTDGSGKQTQTKLLKERLEKEGFLVLSISFPWYGSPSAKMVEKYLAGELGDQVNKIDGYMVSTFYADDRLAHSPIIVEALNKGWVVISDRYVTANMGHQGSKFSNKVDRNTYLNWVYDLEYVKNNIPKPDINFILHVPTEISQRLLEKRGEKKDIHENDPDHLRRAEETYLELPKLFKGFSLIECVENNALLSAEAIHEILWKELFPLLKTNEI